MKPPLKAPQEVGAPGNLSMTYLPLATDMMGTPGTLRMRLFRSRSLAGSNSQLPHT
jgi:hypothetical protein